MKIDRWVFLGIVAAVFNPLPTGLIAGYILYKEKKYRNEGKIITIVAIFLLALELFFTYYYFGSLV